MDVFHQRFADRAELHVATGDAPHDAPSTMVSSRTTRGLVELYGSCDMFAMPTNADLVPWASIEAMVIAAP